nr:MAG: ORF1 [Torque teno midi virus]
MPFWWQRRKKFWRGRYRPWYKRYANQRRRKRKPIRRHRRRRSTRRRYRRRRKVRRKLKTLPLKQWQPKYITKCTIRGLHLYLLGAEGRQMSCYTDEQYLWTPARSPGGGGFSAETYTLQWLYTQYKEGKCYWSKSNSTKDLVRFTGSNFTFYKHHKTDFVIYYNRKPTTRPDKYYYSRCHPYELLLRHRTKVLHRNTIRPNSKQRLKIKVKPPRTLQNNWYSQSEFAEQPLIELVIAAADLTNSYISKVDTNQLLTAYSLSTQFFPSPNWGQAGVQTTAWKPRPTQPLTLTPIYGEKEGTSITIPNTYSGSIAYSTGWFQKAILTATRIKQQNVYPILYLRYNPKIDDGHGNMIYVKHITQNDYSPPTTDKAVLLENKPLWQLLYGYVSYLQKIKPHEDILEDYILCVHSPAIYPFQTNTAHVPLDSNFINGKAPYEQELSAQMMKLWFPKLLHQQQFINNVVECGPFIPKYGRERESSWDLHGKFSFFFKWGGEDTDYQDAYDPSRQTQYAITNNLAEAIQISDPSKQIPSSLIHAWDYRRGFLTSSALKRIRENIPTDETISTDSEPKQKKKKVTNSIPFYNQKDQEIQECLQALYKENTFQTPQGEEQIINLIQEQQQQQEQLKHNLLYLIEDLKKQQTKLRLKTGILH